MMIHRCELSLLLVLLLSHRTIVAFSNPSYSAKTTFGLSSSFANVQTRTPFTFIVTSSNNNHRNADHSRKRQRIERSPPSSSSSSQLLASQPNANNDASHASSPQDFNEFSRKIAPDRVVSVKRDYRMDITATPDERHALAQRFDVELHALQASLQLRSLREGSSSAGSDSSRVNARSTSSSSSGSSSSWIHVEGSVRASVTQTCVRTNEQFRMDVEVPLDCIVRPVVPMNAASAAASDEAAASLADGWSLSQSNRSNNGTTKKKQSKNRDARPAALFDMDLLELQRLLQDDQMDEEENVVEDEAIYAIGGSLDVGELVSQLFWLSLDPYPKKPGSTPIQKSITG